jgi:hypothetical protein
MANIILLNCGLLLMHAVHLCLHVIHTCLEVVHMIQGVLLSSRHISDHVLIVLIRLLYLLLGLSLLLL